MGLIDFLYPPKCIGCSEVLSVAEKKARAKGADALCPNCRAEFERDKLKICNLCGREMIDCVCSKSRLHSVGCSELLKLTKYGDDPEQVVKKLIFCQKRNNDRRCERFLSGQLSFLVKRLISDDASDFCITHIPREKRNIVLYGYDHAERLAKSVSEICGVQYVPLLDRKKKGKEQKYLDGEQRAKNVRNVFRISKSAEQYKDKNIIIIDDVVTTGTSMAECIRELRCEGFEKIKGICIAVT